MLGIQASETVREKPPFMTPENMNADANRFRRQRWGTGGYSAMLCVEFPQVQYIDFWFRWDSPCFESCRHCDKCTYQWFLWPVTFECWGVPWIEVKPGFRGQQKVTKVFLPWTEMFLQDPSIEVAIQRQCEHFSGTKFFVLWMEVSVE